MQGAVRTRARALPPTLLLPRPLPLAAGEVAPTETRPPCVEAAELRHLATRALAAGQGGVAAVGVAGLQHGDGATTVAHGLAVCLASAFAKRVVLVEANQRSPSLRRRLGLADGPGLADVLARRAPLGSVLQATGEHRQLLVLPASIRELGGVTAAGLRELLRALLDHVDAAVVDLAPAVPYRDTGAVCSALDGVALVMRSGHATVQDGRAAIAAIGGGEGRVLGAVLNGRQASKRFFFEKKNQKTFVSAVVDG